MKEQRVYFGWVLVERDEDADEMLWVAHCLEFDIVASGRTVREAIESVRECVGVAVCDDLNADLDPNGRNKAPREDWERLGWVVKNGAPVKISELTEDARLLLASQIMVGVERINHNAVADLAPADPDRLNSFLCAA